MLTARVACHSLRAESLQMCYTQFPRDFHGFFGWEPELPEQHLKKGGRENLCCLQVTIEEILFLYTHLFAACTVADMVLHAHP